MLTANYHTHTTFCDGSHTPEEIVEYALQTGMTHLGFSGHMDPDIPMDFQAYLAALRSLQRRYTFGGDDPAAAPSDRDAAGLSQGSPQRLDILIGIELDALFDPACARETEYVIGSVHYLDVPSPEPASVDDKPEKLPQICRTWFGGDYYKMAKSYYELEASVYDRTGCTFIGHFDLITRFNDDLHFLDENDPRYLKPALEAMRHLAMQGVPFEINCGAVNRGRKKELYPNRTLLRSLREFGGEIFISSDAHQKQLLTGAFDQAVRTAMECGFTHTNLLEHDAHGKVVTRSIALDLLV